MSDHAGPAFQTALSTPPAVGSDQITVRYVGEETAPLDGVDGFETESVATTDGAAADLEDVDCVIGAESASDLSVPDLLAAVREAAPALPFVLLTDGETETEAAVLSRPATDSVPETASPALLADRVRRIVEQRRLRLLAHRALAALDGTGRGIAVVAPDDSITFANPAFARQFDYAPGEVVGRDWRDLYTDAGADRIESEALPSVTDGWRWVGTCDGRRRGGETVPVRTDVEVLEDGSTIIRVTDVRFESG